MKCRTQGNFGMMSMETLKSIVKKALQEAEESCSFMFQGGEPTLRGIEFYEALVKLVKQYNEKNISVYYGIQTNGYCLGEEWAVFFAKNKFLVGISLDGPKEIHDRYRKDKFGKGTFSEVQTTIELFKKHCVEFNVLTVVTADTVPYVNQIYNFYKRENLKFQQYIECLDPLKGKRNTAEYSLTPEMYGNFLILLFKKWCRDLEKGDYVYIRYFENLILMLRGMQPESCNMRGCCTKQWVIEADGSVYPCDFYVLDKWKMGNITVDSFAEMDKKENGNYFVECSKMIPQECRECQWFGLCRNGCRRSCGNFGVEREKNYFCQSYKKFFEYAYPVLEKINNRLG